MSMDYKVSGPEGEFTLNPDYVAEQLRAQGENVTGISPDGMSLTIVDGAGEFQTPIADVLARNGWQLQGQMPSNANYEMANPDMRAAITLLPDDNAKQMFLQTIMTNRGLANAQISGSGRDWFVFDPDAGQYYGLTNNPEWDRTDISEGIAETPGVIGQAVGGVLGGLGAGLPGLAAGAALGGATTRGLTRGAVALADEYLPGMLNGDFGGALMSNPSALGKTMAIEGVMDAGGALLGPVAGKTLGPIAKNVMETGIVSQAAKGLGFVGENVGRGLDKASGFVADSMFGKELASFAVPGAGDAVALGTLSQLPAMGVRGAAKGIGSVGRSGLMQKYAPGLGNRMANFSDDLLKPTIRPTNLSNRLTNQAEEIAAKMRGQSYSTPGPGTAENILGNLGEMMGTKAANNKVYREGLYRYARSRGLPAEEALTFARNTPAQTAGKIADDIVGTRGVRNAQQLAATIARPQSWGSAGQKIGRGLQTIENVGKSMEQGGLAVTGAALRTAQGAGKAMSRTGLASKLAGTVSSPLENRMYVRYGAEEALDPYTTRRPWQSAQSMDKMYMAQK